MKNLDKKTVESFGEEWSKFDQSKFFEDESKKIFNKYFKIFPWKKLSKNCEGFDMGCGSGRWAKFVAPKVGILHCIDPSKAINVARKNLKNFKNVLFYKQSVESVNLRENSQDFGYSLGVLHHVPDTPAAIKSCVKLLKKGSPLLLYLYYSFDNRPKWYFYMWVLSNKLRKIISKFPPQIKNLTSEIIAFMIYYPIARISRILSYFKIDTSKIPLSFYKDKSIYTMRTDSRDRFGTPIESRFSKSQIKRMMYDAGLEKISFSNNTPFWCVVGYKKK